MPKLTLSFNLPEEREEFELANNGATLSYFIDEFDQYLRNKIKYGDLPDAEEKIYEEIRAKFWELRNE